MHTSSGIAPRETGNVVVERNHRALIEIGFSGHITATAVRAVSEGLTGEPPSVLLLDVAAITGNDPETQLAIAGLLETLKARGVVRALCVAPFPSLRAFATAAAFVAGLPLEFHVHRHEALRALRTLVTVPE